MFAASQLDFHRESMCSSCFSRKRVQPPRSVHKSEPCTIVYTVSSVSVKDNLYVNKFMEMAKTNGNEFYIDPFSAAK